MSLERVGGGRSTLRGLVLSEVHYIVCYELRSTRSFSLSHCHFLKVTTANPSCPIFATSAWNSSYEQILVNTMNASGPMTCLRLDYVSTVYSRTSFACVRQRQLHACIAIAAQGNYIPRRSRSTAVTTGVKLGGNRQHQRQQRIVSYRSYAAMPTPTASRIAIIGAGTVGATIAFSLIGMLADRVFKEGDGWFLGRR